MIRPIREIFKDLNIPFLLILVMCLNNMLSTYLITSGFEKIYLISLLFFIVYWLIIINRYQSTLSFYSSKSITSLKILGWYIFVYSLIAFDGSATLFMYLTTTLFSFIVFFVFLKISIKIDFENNCVVATIFGFIYAIIFIYGRLIHPLFAVLNLDLIPMFYNSIYYLILIVPFALHTKLKLLFIIITILCTLLSNKQGAFAALAIGLPFYYFLESKISGKRIRWFFPILIIILVGTYSYSAILSNDKSIDILEGFVSAKEDGGSGRDKIWSNAIVAMQNSTVMEVVFGHGGGFASSRKLEGSLHNDFLEIVYGYGLVALIFYLCFFIYLVRHCIIITKGRCPYAPAFVYSLIAFLVVSLVSHLIFILKYMMLLMMYWGVIIPKTTDYSLKK